MDIDRMDAMMARFDREARHRHEMVISLSPLPSPRQARINLERAMAETGARLADERRRLKQSTETPAKAKRRAANKAQRAARRRTRHADR